MKTTRFAPSFAALMATTLLLHAEATSAAMVVTFDGSDLTTRGTWIGVYGSAGYILAGTKALRGTPFDDAPSNLNGALTDYASLPSYISSYNYDSPSATGDNWNWHGIAANPGIATGSNLQKPASLGAAPYNSNSQVYAAKFSGATTTTFNTLTLNLTGVVPTEFEIHIYAHSAGNIREWGAGYEIGGVAAPTFTARQGGTLGDAVNDNSGSSTVNNDTDILDLGMWHTFTIKNAVAGPLAIRFNYVSGTGVPLSGMMFDTITIPEPSSIWLLSFGLIGMFWLGQRRK